MTPKQTTPLETRSNLFLLLFSFLYAERNFYLNNA